MIRTYSELITFPTFEERFDYLRLNGGIGQETFGYDRWLNQRFYTSSQWKTIRNAVIIRDNGCDLACPDYPIFEKVLIHHLNPVSKEDILRGSRILLDPEFLVCVSRETHNAIHYGSMDTSNKHVVERKPGDTCPWK